MAKKLSAKRKILVASLLVAFVAIATVVSIILVLAATNQKATVELNITYQANGVGVKVSANYYLVNTRNGEITNSYQMIDANGNTEIEFKMSDTSGTGTLVPQDEVVELSYRYSKLVYEYVFTNMSDSPFAITLTTNPIYTNMQVRYKSSGKQQTEFFGDFSDTALDKSQLVLGKGDSIYIYSSIKIADTKMDAGFNGNVSWRLDSIDSTTLKTINLDNTGGTGGQTSIKFVESSSFQLPHLKEVPTRSVADDKVFVGYQNSSNQKAYDKDGNSMASYIGSNNQTITAVWETPEAYTVENGVLTGVSATTANLETIDIPDTVTQIGKNSLRNVSATTINIPSSVTKIGDSAFEGNTAVETVNFGTTAEAQAYAWGGVQPYTTSMLTTIGANAFKGCTSLNELIIPEGVTTIGEGAFQNLSSLTYLCLPTTFTDSSIKLFGTSSLQVLELNGYVLSGGSDTISGLGWKWSDYSSSSGYAPYAYVPTSLEKIIVSSGACQDYSLTPSGYHNYPTNIEIKESVSDFSFFAVVSSGGSSVSNLILPANVNVGDTSYYAEYISYIELRITDTMTSISFNNWDSYAIASVDNIFYEQDTIDVFNSIDNSWAYYFSGTLYVIESCSGIPSITEYGYQASGTETIDGITYTKYVKS